MRKRGRETNSYMRKRGREIERARGADRQTDYREKNKIIGWYTSLIIPIHINMQCSISVR